MLIRPVVLLIASLLSPLMAQGQQSLNPQPASVQAPTVPCIAGTSAAPKSPSNNPGYTVPSKWKKLLDQERQKIIASTGLPVPDIATDIEHAANVKPTPLPCPPKAAATAVVPPAPVMKLPPDTSVTLRCNPLSPAKDASGHQTLTLPDPHDFAVPKGTEFQADSVVPDLAAKTPCYLIKVDPKTQKSFVQQ